jgi:heat shock protein HslJ
MLVAGSLHTNTYTGLYMKNGYLVFLLLWFFTSCTREESISSLTGTWRLTAYRYTETATLEMEPPGLNRSVEIHFTDNGSLGNFSGHTVTNQVFGKYSLQPGYRIAISELGGTMVGEPEWGNKFWENFRQAGFYEVSADKLIIYYKQDEGRMIFERK